QRAADGQEVVVGSQVTGVARWAAGVACRIADPLEGGAGAVVEVRKVSIDVLEADVTLSLRSDAHAVPLVHGESRLVVGDTHRVGVRLDVVPARAEGGPGRDRGRDPPPRG